MIEISGKISGFQQRFPPEVYESVRPLDTSTCIASRTPYVATQITVQLELSRVKVT